MIEVGTMTSKEDIRQYLLNSESLIVMYVGNLESYQGIDLLIDAFALAAQEAPGFELVVIGGEQVDINTYQARSRELGISARIHFLGQRPVNLLSNYLSQADILVSPRIKGKNTPMKIYSYLGSGRPVLATNLETHTQVLNSDVSVLVAPEPDCFARGILNLVNNSELRVSLGTSGKRMIDDNFSLEAFKRRANSLLDWVQSQIILSSV
jgi:glycosyltransferase involved in cell wall biosynthesis